MACAFLDRLFNVHDAVRLRPTTGNVYHLEELGEDRLSARSYVDVSVPNGFVIKHDENFRVKKIFRDLKGFRSKGDFIVVSNEGDHVDYFIVELKSRNYKIERVQRQFRCGVALASYCQRLGLDCEKAPERFGKIAVYAVVLTNTVSEHRGTVISANAVNLDFAGRCDAAKGVYCVNGHSVSLADLRRHAFSVSLMPDKCNDFSGMVPYPGGPDER